MRQINRGQLELGINVYGRDDVDGGGQFVNSTVLFTNPDPITTVQATVTVVLAAAEACPTGNNANVIAGANAVFFNDGTSTGPGDATGDIQATIEKVFFTDLGRVYQAEYFRCNNASCSSLTRVDQLFTSTWNTGGANILTLTWDAANSQFLYTVKRGKTTETITLHYPFTITNPPGVKFKGVFSGAFAVNCSGSRKHAFVDALFDDVMVNP